MRITLEVVGRAEGCVDPCIGFDAELKSSPSSLYEGMDRDIPHNDMFFPCACPEDLKDLTYILPGCCERARGVAENWMMLSFGIESGFPLGVRLAKQQTIYLRNIKC